MKNSSLFQIIGGLLLLCCGITLVVTFTSSNNTQDQTTNSLIASIVLGLTGAVCWYLGHRPDKVDWNKLSFPEQCAFMAKELATGKRQWFLNPLNGSDFLAVPLSPDNMNEMGGGHHIETDEEYILSLLKLNQISNCQLVNGILEAGKKL